jgi:hypothetical protein
MQKLFENWRNFAENKQTDLKDTGSKPEPEHGYVVGDIQGEIFARKNEEQLFWGASMQKPLIALAQLIRYKDDEQKKLTRQELQGLLAYRLGGYESNDVNRILANREPREPDYQNIYKERYARLVRKYKKDGAAEPEKKAEARVKNIYGSRKKKYDYLMNRRDEIGRITSKQAAEFLEKYGLDSKMRIRYGPGQNKQSAMAYFKFLEFLHDAKRISGIQKEVDIIIQHMKREAKGLSRKDRESKKWKGLQQYLNKQGIVVENIYGKGGRIPKKHLHLGLVLNDDIILSIYTASDNRDFFYSKIAEALKSSGKF